MYACVWASWWLSAKEPTCNTGDTGLIPGSGRSPGWGNGNQLQYSCLENPMDRGSWLAIVHRVSKSQTWLKRQLAHKCVHMCIDTHTYIHVYTYIHTYKDMHTYFPASVHQEFIKQCQKIMMNTLHTQMVLASKYLTSQEPRSPALKADSSPAEPQANSLRKMPTNTCRRNNGNRKITPWLSSQSGLI